MTNSTHFDQQDIGYLLTAYADAQLAPEGVMWVEEQLDRNANLRAKLKDIRELQAGLRAAFAGNAPDYQLDLPRRDALLGAASKGPSNKIRFPAPMWIGLAASLMAVAYVGTISIGSLASPRAAGMLANSDSAEENELPPMRLTVTTADKATDAVFYEKKNEGLDHSAKEGLAEELATVDEKRRSNRGPMPVKESADSELAPSDPFAPMAEAKSSRSRERQPVKKPMAKTENSRAQANAPRGNSIPAPTAATPRADDPVVMTPPRAPSPVTTSPVNQPTGNPNGDTTLGGLALKPESEGERQAKDIRRSLANNAKSDDFKSELKSDVPGNSATNLYRDTEGKPTELAHLKEFEVAKKLSEELKRDIPTEESEDYARNRPVADRKSKQQDSQQKQDEKPAIINEVTELTNEAFPGPTLSVPNAQPQQGQAGQRGGENSIVGGTLNNDDSLYALTKSEAAGSTDETTEIVNGNAAKFKEAHAQNEKLSSASRELAAKQDSLVNAEKDVSGLLLAPGTGKGANTRWTNSDGGATYGWDSDKNSAVDKLVVNDDRELQSERLKDSILNKRDPQNRAEHNGQVDQLANSGSQSQTALSWFNNSSQIDPRHSLDSLLAVGNYQIAGDANSLLVMMSDNKVAMQATPAAQQVLQQNHAKGITLKVTNEANASGIIRVARSAQLQAQFTGGLVQLDVAQRPLDPTDYQGYDVATFKKLFGTSPMQAIAVDPIQTVAIDADTASYNYAKARVAAGEPVDASTIKPEHFINAMPMDYPPAQGPEAFSLFAEAGPSPFARTQTTWGTRTALVTIGAVAKPAAADERRPLSLTLAIDCSGSMAQPGGLDRIQKGLQTLIQNLRAEDNVSVVAFGDQARVILPATPGNDPTILQQTIQNLTTGGATNAAEGLALAYQLAAETAKPGVESRVLLATDGGTVAGADDLLRRVTAFKDRGITLVVVGCGQTYHAGPLQELTTKGDGQHYYVGSDEEATHLFSTSLLPDRLGVLAKDAKLQVTWNPQRISHARLIGYDQRRLAAKDFRDNTVDAGELSQDTQVTALFEVLLVDGGTGPLGNAAVRYYDTRRESVREIACPLPGSILATQPSDRLRLVACAAATAEWLQRGWWSNVHLITPQEIQAQLDKCPQPIAQELKQMVIP